MDRARSLLDHLAKLAHARALVTAGDVMQTKGTVFRSYLQVLRGMGAYDDVFAKLPAQAQALFQNPPTASQWIDTAIMDQILQSLEVARSPQAVFELGKKTILGPQLVFLKPMIRGVFAVMGANPHHLLGRANSIVMLTSKGTTLSYANTGDKRGIMSVQSVRATPVVAAQLWAGIITAALELCKANGEVVIAGQSADLSVLTLEVSWA